MPLSIALLRSDGPHHHFLDRALANDFEIVAVVEEPGAEQVRRLWRAGRWRDWFWWRYHSARRRLLGLDRYRRRYFADAPPVPTGRIPNKLQVSSINDPAVPCLLRRALPDVTVVIGTSILRQAVLNAAGPTVINIHGGYLPYYRGNHCFFFALYDGRPDLAGTTIHFVDTGIDTGQIIEVVPADARPGENAEELYCRAERRAIRRLVELIRDYQWGRPLPRRPQAPGGRCFRMRDRQPHHDAILWFRRILFDR